MDSLNTILSVKNLTVGYKSKTVLNELNLTLSKGEVTALLGPNGSGKSTLLRTISSIQEPISGGVLLEEKSLESISRKELAKQLSLVLTNAEAPGNLTVFALVALGRFPYTSWMGQLKKEDNEIIYRALDQTGLLSFANRHVGELSDGERQKVMIARALVQDTPLIFLDEPTTHLDSPNRIEVFHLLRTLAHDFGKTILVTTHEIDLALAYADSLWLIGKGQRVLQGLPEDLVLSTALETAFHKEELVFDYTKGAFTKGERSSSVSVEISGDEILKKWTEKALLRASKINSKIEVVVTGEVGNPLWDIPSQDKSFKTIKELITHLLNQENEKN